jgi:microsomal dipeptidase-like Zn-dependent dipeptidase
VASHTGPRACSDFARYLTDDEAVAVAGPARPTVEAFVVQARHLAGLVGPDHLCLGTDMTVCRGSWPAPGGETDLAVLHRWIQD